MSFLKVLVKNIVAGPSTVAYPFGEPETPAAYRGRVAFDAGACTGCRMCEYVCPAGAIRFDERDDGLHFAVWHNSCANCGHCAHYCPTKAIRLTNDWHMAHLQSEKYALADHAVVPRARCTRCGADIGYGTDAIVRHAYRGVARQTEHLARLCPDCRRAASIKGASL
ncbi:CooX [uncultured Pleomorphomonas sp.]|uniref:4Fe-4S ferredoxin n=2 Tax=Pleomorphomonas TaxID=261933 RepID=A0A2G9WZZ9_9HYPH|nr:4Fe-4S binding protein [Pleomorphomonas carboxyditropha]PIP00250.1 4Fe-4S ferredoxin [Pleomorphomonas carboxyditropha]SCM76160.1 CooX [uncultured Pleomorphomonas sp.]